MASIKCIESSFEKVPINYSKGVFTYYSAHTRKIEKFTIDLVKSLIVLDEKKINSYGKALGIGLGAGLLVAGPVGMIGAAALSTLVAKKKGIVFELVLCDERRLIGTIDSNAFFDMADRFTACQKKENTQCQCGNIILIDQRFCSQCGFQNEEIDEREKQCQCGEMIIQSTKFCSNCGTPIVL